MSDPGLPSMSEGRGAEEFAQALRAQRRRLQEFLAAFRDREARAQAQLSVWVEQFPEIPFPNPAGDASAIDPAELAALRLERTQLAQKLAQTEKLLDGMTERLSGMERQLASAQPSAGEGAAAEEYRRRYEMAVQDVRELRTRNEELEKQLQERSAQGASAAATAGAALDWEAEKRRILAALEAEGEDDTEPGQKKRLELQAVVRSTDQIVAEKNREIVELRQLLENQSANLGSVAVGAAALGAVLDNDAIVKEERENLRRLQRESEEKLRQAEIDLSLERAKLARQRAELEEKLRSQGSQEAKGEDDPAAHKPEKPARGRWLSRLGLKDSESDK